MARLVDIDNDKFWDILFDEAYVEGNQAERIEKELNKITTNGWIPYSEDIPKENGWYLVTNNLGVVQQQFWGASHWHKLRDEAVLAWQPLPEPYQPKGE
jgi:hypothetical protein